MGWQAFSMEHLAGQNNGCVRNTVFRKSLTSSCCGRLEMMEQKNISLELVLGAALTLALGIISHWGCQADTNGQSLHSTEIGGLF